MQRIRIVLCVSLAVVAAILLTTITQTFAANIMSGPLAEMQKQINAMQGQINALTSNARQYHDLQEYTSVAPGVKVFQATRFIKTPTFYPDPYNLISGTLTIEQKHEGDTLVLVWEEDYGEPNNPSNPQNPNIPTVAVYPSKLEILNDVTTDGIYETGYRVIAMTGPYAGQHTSTATYYPRLLVFPYGKYAVGDMWGDAYNEEFVSTINPAVKQYMSRLYQYAIVGVDTVTVPAGIYTDCIKIARFRGNQTDRIAWYAKGIGMVKFIVTSPDITPNNTLNGIYELLPMTPTTP